MRFPRQYLVQSGKMYVFIESIFEPPPPPFDMIPFLDHSPWSTVVSDTEYQLQLYVRSTHSLFLKMDRVLWSFGIHISTSMRCQDKNMLWQSDLRRIWSYLVSRSTSIGDVDINYLILVAFERQPYLWYPCDSCVKNWWWSILVAVLKVVNLSVFCLQGETSGWADIGRIVILIIQSDH